MIPSGFHTPLTLFIISSYSRHDMSKFFSELIRFLYINAISEHKLISDRLYRRYLKKDEIYRSYALMKSIELEFIKSCKVNGKLYSKYINLFYKACEENFDIIQNNLDCDIGIRVSLEIPYSVDENRVENEIYDRLSSSVKPFWLREVSMKEYIEKYSVYSTTPDGDRL